ncbi:MAG: amidase [Chloroflexi bacterium]|nr:amidase [Chloroflexota bacterium]
MEPFRMTIAQASSLVQSRTLSPVDLMESLLQRIERLEPHLKAWAYLDREKALAAARRCEEEISTGHYRGPLHGIPIGVKDIFYTSDMPTSAAFAPLVNFVPTYDASAVSRLREAGAIIMGKTVTTQFAYSDPSPTRNPWNPAHTPGGSSSGSAVAVATSMCFGSLGSQTAGSTCRPASYNGIVGLKPTSGRISRYGVIPLAWSLDTVGVMARSVEDTAILLQAIAGFDPKDPATSSDPVPDYRFLFKELPRPPRLGLVREFFFDTADEETRQHTEQVAQKLARAGATVEELRLPESFRSLHQVSRLIINVEAAAVHRSLYARYGAHYSRILRTHIMAGMVVPASEYLRALQHQRLYTRQMFALFQKADAILVPSTPGPAPRDLSTTGDPAFQVPWTHGGFPSISIPSGLSRDGLPLGVQLATPRFSEGRLLSVAHWAQSVLGVHLTPPDQE